MISIAARKALDNLVSRSNVRYGQPASTHECMGVALEEWHELIEAVHANDAEAIRHEALDLAAILIRMHDAMGSDPAFIKRSGCNA